MGMKSDLWVENLGAPSDGVPAWFGIDIAAIRVLECLLIDCVEDRICVIGPTLKFGAESCCRESVGDFVRRICQEFDGVILGVILRVVPEKELVIFLVRLFDTFLTEAMSIKGTIRLDIDEFNTTILTPSDSIFDSCVKCDAHMVKVFSQLCGQVSMLFPIIIWVRLAGEGDIIACCLDLIKEFSVACDV